MNSTRKKTMRLSDEKERLLRAAVRAAMHELNQSLTALSFTATNLRLLAEKHEQGIAHSFSKELLEMSSQMSEAEIRYRKTTSLLDWLTVETDALKKIDVDSLITDVLKLSETASRRYGCQIQYVKANDIIQIHSFCGALTYLLFSVLWTLMESSKSRVHKNERKITLETAFHAAHISIRFHVHFEDVAVIEITKKLAKQLKGVLKIEKSGIGGAASILLSLPHHHDNVASE